MPAKNKDHTAITRAQLTRVLEAATRIEYPTEKERDFRVAVMKRLPAVAELPQLGEEAVQERAIDVRSFEAVAKIERPNEEERAFRELVMSKLGVAFGLKAMRNVSLVPAKK